MIAAALRLRKHADYQSTYKSSRKQFSKQMTFFFNVREEAEGVSAGPRIGLTVGKVLGKAVDRNRIKRRMRAAVSRHVGLLRSPVDVILHPRRSVLTMDFPMLEREIAQIFRTIQRAAEKRDTRDSVQESPPSGS